MKKTKIVCTIGPVTESVETLKELLKRGMNVMRLNFSHGDYEEHGMRIKNFRQAMSETGIRGGLLLDTKGPEIRTMTLENGKDVSIKAGQKFTFTTDQSVVGNSQRVAVTYKDFAKDLKVGNMVLVDDGLLELDVVEINGNEVVCVARNSGDLGEKKGINLPGISVNLPALSEKDIEDLKFGCRNNIDFVAASFIRKASDVNEVRKVLQENGGERVQIISKIESQEGLDNFDKILEASDGIMVARGDLGVEIPVEEVPCAQKMMIKKCNRVGKVVITATQMLDSMIKNPRPTRAEANDVANAIIDGTDAIMLSGETAKGKYPLEAVDVMNKIAQKVDPTITSFYVGRSSNRHDITSAVAEGSADISERLEAKLIVVGTESGRAARNMRRYFPKANILAITNNEKTANQLILSRGIIPYVDASPKTLEEFFILAESIAKRLKLVENGDIIVVTCGESVFIQGTTNSIKVIQVKD
ncbi:pyruvate kinase PykF [Fusobacterium simiae]|uniref:Pyruvate kinase n=1 Tax=Fusobacterium simiae TaxID=855 RepID=A0ABT4DN38_FUSSI|nr:MULTISPECIES: pyruvate kinase PykF [Fusobacterium]MCY7008704.1 pyruvate kinase PykF [Fusobacterium simiae]